MNDMVITKNKRRGEVVYGQEKAQDARYIGTSKAGTVWLAYQGDNFEEMCRAFDNLAKK